jgi:signal transduction histidine kinase
MRLTVQFFGPTNVVESLVDAEVRLRGICFYQFNHSRQILSPVLMVPESPQLTVEKPAPANPFTAPLRQPQSLLLYSMEGVRRHRVRVQGTVLHQVPGQALWLRDAGHGLRVETRQALALEPGDQIEALGFPGSGDYTPVLEDAIFRKISPGTNAPLPLSVQEKNDALEHDADLIRLEGELIELTRTVNGWQLTVNWKGLALDATMPKLQPLPKDWQPGSHVRLTGICRVTTDSPSTAGGIRQPREFQLLLRSIADVTVLQKSPWWTPARLVIAAGTAAGLSLLAAAFVAWLARHRLHEQALRRKMAETEFSAMFTERNRIAREIHDTLAQGLGAISMHLEMVKEQLGRAPEKAAKHLDIAHQMARQSLGEARNSIWNMRSQILENTDLASALQGILKQFTDDTEIHSQFTVTGPARRLAPAIENNLLRVGQEAITNAVKHAHAKNISATLHFSAAEAGLIVRDDGSGFDPAHPPGGGHFGMLGQRERTAQMGGKLEVTSAPGQGTEVRVRIPIYD